jgi:hypothetical protein
MSRPSVVTNRIDVEMKRFIHGMRRSDSKMKPFIPADGRPNRVREGLVAVSKPFIHATKRLVMTAKALIHMNKRPAIVSGFPPRREIAHLRKIDVRLSIFAIGHPESTPRFGLTE